MWRINKYILKKNGGLCEGEGQKWEVAEWKGEGVKPECFGAAATTNSADLESRCVLEISFKKPL